MTDLIDRQTVLDLVKSVCKNELYKRKGPYDYQRQDYVFDYTPEVATILRLNKTIREAIIDLPSQYEETQSERVCRYIERKRKEEMGDLISRKEAYIILAEHYHLKTYIQQDALWDALSRVPDAEATGGLHEREEFPKGFFQKQRPEAMREKYDQFEGVEVQMIKDDEIVVAFCNAKVAEELQLPKEAAVITELLGDNESIVVPKDEFLKWLRGEDD